MGTKHNSFSDRRNHMNEFGQVKTKAANKGAALSKRGENGTNYWKIGRKWIPLKTIYKHYVHT